MKTIDSASAGGILCLTHSTNLKNLSEEFAMFGCRKQAGRRKRRQRWKQVSSIKQTVSQIAS